MQQRWRAARRQRAQAASGGAQPAEECGGGQRAAVVGAGEGGNVEEREKVKSLSRFNGRDCLYESQTVKDKKKNLRKIYRIRGLISPMAWLADGHVQVVRVARGGKGS